MYSVTKDIINLGILNYDIEKEENYNHGVMIFLNKHEVLNSCFFDRIFEVKIKYNCDIDYKYSEKYDCIVIVIH